MLLIGVSCNEMYVLNYPPQPSHQDYFGYLNVKKTDGKFVTTTLEGPALPSDDYKIVVFPSSIEFKSLYIAVGKNGAASFEYKLDKTYEIESGYNGTVIGVLQLITSSQSDIINIPVVYMP